MMSVNSTAADEDVVTGRLLTADEVAELTGMTKEWAQARADASPSGRAVVADGF